MKGRARDRLPTRAAVKEENLDQTSSPDQVQWYYQHKPAV